MKQREIIYERDAGYWMARNMRESIFHMINDYIENTVDMVISPDQESEDWNLTELNMTIHKTSPWRLSQRKM